MRIVVAMSGGVDSSVAAALVKEAGHEAIGVTLKLLQKMDTGFGCCGSPKDVDDAKRVAEKLGIPHYTVDMAEMFEQKVITPFVDSYKAAETPNPCVECNRSIKFHYLMNLAHAWNAEKVATGHYARISKTSPVGEVDTPAGRAGEGPFKLLRALDDQKDQSYFLHTLTQKELSKSMFPVGELTKPQVREKAHALGLGTADKKESFEICFVPKKDYRAFLTIRGADSEAGQIVDKTGAVLGQHTGLTNYTLGQREGLGIATGKPAYVVALDRAKNQLVVGDREDALISKFNVRNITWTQETSPVGEVETRKARPGEGPLSVKVRHRAKPVPAKVSTIENGIAVVELLEPQFAPAPGQSAVFYSGDEVLGGGIITR